MDLGRRLQQIIRGPQKHHSNVRILGFPNYSHKFLLAYDASDLAVGADHIFKKYRITGLAGCVMHPCERHLKRRENRSNFIKMNDIIEDISSEYKLSARLLFIQNDMVSSIADDILYYTILQASIN
ncbi:hypothetical protein RF11_11320 [Thelohanellus kitauei]|uniref:Uncharacterized protein n=1 Tax=Thelohanellus kitauei TaxID=669202 RepID=A0A0C2M2E5_THEKT|nr:hypothetical protein RF11_11320 [Thelohanellus kitauei]